MNKGSLWMLMVLTGLTTAAIAESAPAAERIAPLMKDFMGLNGHTILFRPELYKTTCRLVRDYHNFNWDMGADTSAQTQFPMTRNDVNGKPRSWKDEVYGPWRQHGWDIDISIQFSGLNAEDWKDLPRDAYNYGKAFAEYFGPSGPNKLADSVEIGNEPGWYDDAFYRSLFENMAKGIRDGDPKLKIATCASEPGPSHRYAKSLTCVLGLEDLYDVINIHIYAFKTSDLREWTYPEDPEIDDYLGKVDRAIVWRDVNAPGKELWITEFGWDACTQPAPETGKHSRYLDVSDEEQAQYLIRSYLLFASKAVDRAYMFFYNDDDEPGLFGASGLTRNFEPKPSFYAMAHLYQSMGEYRFNRKITEQAGKLYAYEFVNGSNPKEVIWAVWNPTDERRKRTHLLQLPARPHRVQRMPITAKPAESFEVPVNEDNVATLDVNGSPMYLWITLP